MKPVKRKKFRTRLHNKCRKVRPSAPHWFWWGQDGCWNCPNENNCGQCPLTKQFKKSKQLVNQYRKDKNIGSDYDS